METEYYFNRLRADNMELFYEHNFNFWFVHNSSHTKFNEELLTGAMKDVRAVTNALGFREDKITTSKIDISGFKIKEPEFIEYEKDKILSLLKDSTNSQLKRKLNHYLGFIQKKELQFETSQPHQVEEKQNESFTFENNFDNVDPKDVYNHFKAGLVDKKYIDLETLETFLTQAFNEYKKGVPPKVKLNMNNTTYSLNFIIGVFHKYYSKQVSKHGKKSKYVKLLTDNFIDFDYKKTYNNFRS